MTPTRKTCTMIMISRNDAAATAPDRDEPARRSARPVPPRLASLLPPRAAPTAFAIRRIPSRDPINPAARTKRHN